MMVNFKLDNKVIKIIPVGDSDFLLSRARVMLIISSLSHYNQA